MRIVMRLVGFLLGIAGMAALTIGVAAALVIGPDDTVRWRPTALGSAGIAVTTAPELIEVFGPTVTVHAESADGRPLWLGVAEAGDLASYLGDRHRTEIDAVRLPRTFGTRMVGSDDAGVARPATRDWWVVDAAGTAPTLAWPMSDGRFGLVLLRADGQPGVQASVTMGVRVVGLFRTALVVVGSGLAGLIAGSAVFRLARRRPVAAADPAGGPNGAS